MSTQPIPSKPIFDPTLLSQLTTENDPIHQEEREHEALDAPLARTPDESSLKDFYRLLQALREERANQGEAPKTSELYFDIPEDQAKLFEAPLNKHLLDRDYALWKRLLSVSQIMFTHSALISQGILKSSAILGGLAGLLLHRYLPVYSVALISGYSAYRALANVKNLFFGNDPLSDRKELWKNDNGSLGDNKWHAITGSMSTSERIKSAFFGAVQGYVAIAGHDILFKKADNPLTSYAISIFQATKDWILPIPLAVVGGGIAYCGLLLIYMVNGQGMARMNEELKGATEDYKFKSIFNTLSYQSKTEYLRTLYKQMDVENQEELEEKREAYKQEVLNRMEDKEMLGAKQVKIDTLGLLKSLDEEHPESVIRPALAQLIVLKEEKKEVLKNYNELVFKNEFIEAQKYLNDVVKPLLLNLEFIKQVILDPSRPPLGILQQDASKYYSYISLLAGHEIQVDITLTDPEKLSEFFNQMLINEAALHKMHCFQNGVMQTHIEPVNRQEQVALEQES